jgi:hypothetical protein
MFLKLTLYNIIEMFQDTMYARYDSTIGIEGVVTVGWHVYVTH